ncbi:hypothetical protein NW768_005625 [Fusarium equiseti]|uniref:Uncharacterized protein n=1 Tax=Fusarium equiseti TaxID=61235 RepID=A0ABQ8RCE0_FUSEQ|nr:hypothetical protein NW768_005625 [Fusarium equiseti]
MSLEMNLIMEDKPGEGNCSGDAAVRPELQKNVEVQFVLSLAIGVSAFLLFCFLRPRWPSLYAARKRRLDHQLGLPTLPNSAFGWIPTLYRITEEQVLASAGLDAFVFLSFFKMAIRLFTVMACFATLILLPINKIYEGFSPLKGGLGNKAADLAAFYESDQTIFSNASFIDVLKGKDKTDQSWIKTWLWAYVFFTYFFVGLTVYYLNLETHRVIKFRQDYLGSQSTVTDRTFRLTGIPEDLRSEDAIKNLIEKLEIGTVERVLICREWKKLDDLVDARDTALRCLEGAWATFLKHQRQKRKDNGHQRRRDRGASETGQDEANGDAGENGRLLDSEQEPWDSGDEGRPKVNIRYGTFGLRSRNVDAIDYYEERLRRLDAQVTEARKKSYAPTDMAIVTMDSVASCQMAIQARIDPRPGRLLTKLTPAPSDLIWRNTYAPRGIRRLKSWAVTTVIIIVTLVFITPTAFLAGLMTPCAIERASPALVRWLKDHTIIYSLASNGLPALAVSLLNVAVPYLYDFLSNQQGMISQGDVELSVISKNYFFTFFNTFFVFAVSKTGIEFWSDLQKIVKDTSKIPQAIADDVEQLSIFYVCFIMLQGIGLMPFRILEAGSVFLHPFLKWLSKTPRDALELKKPPVFQYGFFLPTSLLVFNLCIIYSVLNFGFAILIVGLVYFILGYFTFKYMVLYAMDQPQHATGGAWRIICYRVIVGLLVFELVMVGRIAVSQGFIQSVSILPLIPFSIWYSYYIKRRYEPLTKYIALRAIRADEDSDDAAAMDDAFEDENAARPSQTLLRRGSTLDEYKEKGMQFNNPSLVAPLPQPWIYDEPPPPIITDDTQSTQGSEHPILQGVDGTLAEFDTSHGLCVAATFSVAGGDSSLEDPGECAGVTSIKLDPPEPSDTDVQMIVLYTIPLDLFAVISQGRCRRTCMNATQYEEGGNTLGGTGERIKGSCTNTKLPESPSARKTMPRPVEIRGQPISLCHNLVELAMDLGPDTVLWAFSTQGWARAWALRSGRGKTSNRAIVQADGTLRQVDFDGDYIMSDDDQIVTAPNVIVEPLTNLQTALSTKTDAVFQLPQAERYHGCATRILESNSNECMVSIVLNGIARLNMELN